jgi:hypothetical protein
VERLPSYWASKRNDDAFIVSGKVQAHRLESVFGEYARYIWGPAASSAEMLGIDPAPVDKTGYYGGAEVGYPVTPNVVVGAALTREKISRDDSLIKFLAANGLYGAEMGKQARSTTMRLFVKVRTPSPPASIGRMCRTRIPGSAAAGRCPARARLPAAPRIATAWW